MLLKVTDSNPWYANIVNFMVAGYVPPGENKKKLIFESRRHLWDPLYLYRVCTDGLLRRCVPTAEGVQIIEKCHTAAYGGHFGAFRTQAKIWQSGFFWPTMYDDTREFIRRCRRCQMQGGITARNAMPSHTIFKSSYVMSGELISWDHSKSPMIAGTFWSLWTSSPNG